MPDNKIKVVLLCAGYATRLYPLTENFPKPLLKIADRPMIEHILERLRPVEAIDEILVVTNHKFAAQFSAWAASYSYRVPVAVVDDGTDTNENRLGAIGDMAFALKKHQVGAEDVIVVAGDNLFDFDLSAFVAMAKSKRPYPVIAGYDVKTKELACKYGILQVDGTGKVTQFLEKPANPPSTLASCGLYWLPAEIRSLLDRYLSDGHNADQPGHYMRWLAETYGLYAAQLEGCWYDIGDLESYKTADALFVSKRQ